ncbi:diacylglycerol/lipid kinase family protein [Heyndrickxia sp. NPDC080065]|uniref:diacylglycerol/lipid kinase family protein n=1 Tax=Heyndrickxia sp. NPDC080065 TaxID=3390568 RepID=UPI003CFD9C96
MKKLVFIVNPVAKNGVSLKVWRRIERKLLDIPHEVYYSKERKDAMNIAFSIAVSSSDPMTIVAVGGDGTIHEVINGVASFSHVTISYIPAGSGNDFARGFKLPSNPEKCLDLLLHMVDEKEEAYYDVGEFKIDKSEGYFVNSLGAGFDALISEKVNSSSIKKILNRIGLGKIVYAVFLIVELFRYRPSTLYLTINGIQYTFDKAWFVTVSNQSYYGGGMKIAPQANPSDGEFDITVVHLISRVKLLFAFISVFWGGHTKFKEVKTFKGNQISIKSDIPISVHTDGEAEGRTPVEINVRPRAWKLIKTVKNTDQITA